MERSGTAGGMKRVLPVEAEEGLQCGVGLGFGVGVGGAFLQGWSDGGAKMRD